MVATRNLQIVASCFGSRYRVDQPPDEAVQMLHSPHKITATGHRKVCHEADNIKHTWQTPSDTVFATTNRLIDSHA